MHQPTNQPGHRASIVTPAHAEHVHLTGDSAPAAHFERDVIPLIEALRKRAMQMTFAAADAEDLTQETLCKAYAGRHSFQPQTNLKAWLFRIMTNTYISNYRTKKRRPTQFPIHEVTDRQLAASTAHRCAGLRSAEDQALDVLPDLRIRAAMAALPEQFRAVVYFADVAGLSYKEIAAVTGTEEGTVCSRLSRGRKHLRRLLATPSIPGAGQHSPG